MTRPLSNDLRERVVAAVLRGESCRAVASRFGVAVSSVVKWSQRRRLTGSAAAKPMGRQQPRSLAGERDWVLARLAAVPDLTLRALVVELGERHRQLEEDLAYALGEWEERAVMLAEGT